MTVRHPAAFSLRAARKIPQILMITIPGADSRTRPRARRSPPPAPTFSTATRARSCARSSNTMSPTCARARALAGRPTRAQSHSQDRRRETPTHRAHKRAISRRHDEKREKTQRTPPFLRRTIRPHTWTERIMAGARTKNENTASSKREKNMSGERREGGGDVDSDVGREHTSPNTPGCLPARVYSGSFHHPFLCDVPCSKARGYTGRAR